MKKIMLAALSAGIFSGCSSPPPLATPKGAFVEMNTDITSLLPRTQPVFVANKTEKTEAKPSGDTKTSIGLLGKKDSVAKQNTPSPPLNKKQMVNPVELKGFVAPVITTTSVPVSSKPSLPAVADLPHTPDKPKDKNPFSGTESKTISAPVKPVVQPPLVKSIRNWDIKKGTMLRAAFTELVVKEKCGSGFWQVDWNADGVDYPIDGPLHFSGEFETFYSELFKLYKNADIPLYVHKWPNCVIEIRR